MRLTGGGGGSAVRGSGAAGGGGCWTVAQPLIIATAIASEATTRDIRAYERVMIGNATE